MKTEKLIREIRYLQTERGLKAVVAVRKRVFTAALTFRGETLTDAFNDREPYDRKTHVFYLPAPLPQAGETLTFRCRRKPKNKRERTASFPFGQPDFADIGALLEESDSRIVPVSEERHQLCDGTVHTHYLCEDKNGAPVHVHEIVFDSRKASLYVGTPNDGYELVRVRAKVPEMLADAVKNGVNAVAAVNADFFDIWGDFHPSGPCVKNGRVVANETVDRPFIGIKKDGTPVIASVSEDPAILKKLDQAAAGLQMIVKDGKVCDWAPLEPFGYTRHPRTAAGVTKDGKVILLEVDGRIPAYSNGATLLDLANWMLKRGANRALNLDGGGSSIVYIKQNGQFELQSNPADLFRPNAKLIRKEFNCLIVTEK